MKKITLSLFSISILVLGLQTMLTSSSNGRGFAANSGNTGAPGEATTCRTCHGTGFGTTVNISIKDSNGVAVTSYIPGEVYDAEFTVNASGASRFGFQLVSLNSSNSPINGFSTPASNTRLVTLGNGRQYAEHKGKSITNSFATKWTAPQSGSGTIVFYGGGAAVNNNGNTGGDGGNITTFSLSENTTVGFIEASLRNELLIYPNPTRNVIKLRSTSELKGVKAELYTTSGQLVLSEELSLATNDVQKLNVSRFERGLYILKISNGSDSLEEKIMINE